MKRTKLFIVCAGFLIFSGFGKSDFEAGKDHFLVGAFDKAVESFTKAIQSNPKGYEAYFSRGATFSAMGRFDQAIEDYTKTIELNPQHPDAYWSRGYCYANKGMEDQAIRDYTESLKLGTQQKALVYELRAGAYFRKSMWNEAEADLKSILEIEPENPNALGGLEDVKKAKADPDFNPRALKYRPINEQPQYGGIPPTLEEQQAHDRFIEEVIKINGTRERATEETLKAAWEYYKQKDFTTAMKRFNQAWLLDRDNPQIFYGYSKILRVWGYDSEAEKWEQKAKEGGYEITSSAF